MQFGMIQLPCVPSGGAGSHNTNSGQYSPGDSVQKILALHVTTGGMLRACHFAKRAQGNEDVHCTIGTGPRGSNRSGLSRRSHSETIPAKAEQNTNNVMQKIKKRTGGSAFGSVTFCILQ
jgi:hypothetical protein